MRALLDLLRENEPAEHLVRGMQCVLQDASSHLKILDAEHGEEDLVKSMEVASAELLR